MKLSKEIRRELCYVGAGLLVGDGLICLVYALLGRFSYTVVLGAVLGSAVALLNLALLGGAVQGLGDYTEQEKADILKKLEGKKVTINRSKGLGENDPEMMWMTTMNPETRRVIKVMPDDAARTQEIFDLLLGDNLAGRKEHIAENGYQYLDQLDVS